MIRKGKRDRESKRLHIIPECRNLKDRYLFVKVYSDIIHFRIERRGPPRRRGIGRERKKEGRRERESD